MSRFQNPYPPADISHKQDAYEVSPSQDKKFTFGPTRAGASFYLTMVIRLPDHQKARAALAGDVEVLVDLHGGEITLYERFEAALPPGEAEAIREEHAAGLPLPGADELEG